MTAAAMIILAALAYQPEPKPAQPAETKPAQPAETKPAQPAKPATEPSLDELLGLPKGPAPADKPAPPEAKPASTDKPQSTPRPIDPTKAELQRQLSPKEIGDLFDQAVEGMGTSAVRLAANDTGIDTQRVQEDVIRKLDTLIEEARKQQKKSKSKSKQQQQQQQQSQDQQQNQQQSSQRNPGQSSDSNNMSDGPARQDGPGRSAPGGTAAWGNLPAHVRDALSQGRDDRYSSLYRGLTEKYYKRLAEEPKPGDAAPMPAPNPAPATPTTTPQP